MAVKPVETASRNGAIATGTIPSHLRNLEQTYKKPNTLAASIWLDTPNVIFRVQKP
jgi:hypothetical protein